MSRKQRGKSRAGRGPKRPVVHRDHSFDWLVCGHKVPMSQRVCIGRVLKANRQCYKCLKELPQDFKPEELQSSTR